MYTGEMWYWESTQPLFFQHLTLMLSHDAPAWSLFLWLMNGPGNVKLSLPSTIISHIADINSFLPLVLSLFLFSSSIPDGDDEESPACEHRPSPRRLVSVHVLRLFCQPGPAGLAVQLPACNRRVRGAYLWWVSLVNNTRYPQAGISHAFRIWPSFGY